MSGPVEPRSVNTLAIQAGVPSDVRWCPAPRAYGRAASERRPPRPLGFGSCGPHGLHFVDGGHLARLMGAVSPVW